jgi:flagellum-specific peptidoglycan hydrolase FlgJ
MGKTKHLHDEEGIQKPTTTRTNTGAARQSAGVAFRKTKYLREEVLEHMPFWKWIQQTQKRLHRYWLAGKHRFHRYTLGTFKHRQTVNALILVTLGYFVFFSDLFSPDINGVKKGSAATASMPIEAQDVVGWKPKNDAAPVGANQLTTEMANEYIEQFGKVAIAEMNAYGVPASIALAQGLVESRAGASRLARRNNNHFGMKCFSKKCPKGHCSNFTDDHHKDFFRIYKNPWESWRAHSQMISTGRYARLRKYGRDYRQWAYGLKSLGYATDRTYAEKLIGMIERYDLHRFDK